MAFVSKKFGILASTLCHGFKLNIKQAHIKHVALISTNYMSRQSLLSSRFFFNYRSCSTKPEPKKDLVTLKFVKADGEVLTTKSKVGDNLLDVIIDNDIDIDGFGACEGTLACSTCHLIFKDADYNSIPEKPTDEELDMLDLAYALTDTSRLGCQVIVTKAMEGWEIQVPQGVADAREP